MAQILQFKPKNAFIIVSYTEKGGYKMARRYESPRDASAFFWRCFHGAAISGVIKTPKGDCLASFDKTMPAATVRFYNS